MELADVEKSNIHHYIDCFEKKIIENEQLKFYCKICKCKSILSDAPCAIRHLKRVHKEFCDAINISNVVNQKENQLDPSIGIRVKVDPKDILKSCIDLITKHALPLSFVEYQSFQNILRPYKIALALKGINLVINRSNVKNYIERNAKQIQKFIRNEVRGKLICLMIDSASRYNKSVLGVNIAYVIDGKVIVRTIGMHVLHCTQTAINITNIIKKNLFEFGISLSQIISVTSDNGKNMKKSAALLDSEYQKEKEVQNEIIVEGETVADSDEDIDDDIFDDTYYADLLENVRYQFTDFLYTDLIQGITCAAHCFHLIVTKAINKCNESSTLIEKCRNLAIKLRTPTFREMIIKANLKLVTMEVSTRWNSTYIMFQGLLDLKGFCDEHKHHKTISQHVLNENQWIELERLLTVLRPFSKYTQKLQAINCTLSDFFSFWTAIRLNMEKRDHPLKVVILNEMAKYEPTLLKNPVLVAAVYLDPRYQRVLSAEEKRLACALLTNIHIKYQVISQDRSESLQNDAENNNNESDSFDDFAQYLNSFNNSNQINTSNIEELIQSFDGKRESLRVSPFEYWEKYESEFPELYKLSQAIFAVPPTQSSVERCFSSLPIVLTARRTRLADDCLQEILLIKNNQNISFENLVSIED